MSNPLPRLTAALAGRYRIERELGEGGMATVYLAEDLKHERKVALKVLRPELAAVIGAERFLVEIKTTANLQHPHILPLFDSGEADGFLYYVMPYIEGETLRDRIAREQQLGVEEAARVARDVADALDYAHRHDVIHRDIKPANILLHDGRPVVADFGIALAISAAGGGRMTETGLSLGTPHYMSPEQASADRDLTARSDIYSLGCVLYEMLAGQPPHTGPSAQSVLVRILTEDPRPITDVRRSVPRHIAATVTKAIEKLPADRFESAKAFRDALQDEAFSYAATPRALTAATSATPPRSASWLADTRSKVAVAGLVVLLAFTAWGWLSWPAPPAIQPVTRAIVDISGIELHPVNNIVISPDGSRFAVAGTLDDKRGLFVRNADEVRFRPLSGPLDPAFASFSPDGAWIVYTEGSDRSLMKIALSGGAPRVVIPESADLVPGMAHWADDGTILFSGSSSNDIGIYRVPDTGGEATLIAEGDYYNPRLLPGGRGVLFTDPESTSTRYLDLAADTIIDLIPGGIDARYIATYQATGQAAGQPSHDATGHILYADVSGGLWALPFDVDEGVATGQAVPVLDGITTSFDRFARYDVSMNGTLVYGSGGGLSGGFLRNELVVVTLTGDETVLPLAPRSFNSVSWSPDGASVAYAGNEPGGDLSLSIYVYEVDLGTTPRRLTFGDRDFSPVWSPDGSRLAFSSTREGTDGSDLWVKAVVDDTPPEALLDRPDFQSPSQWLTGDLLLFWSGGGSTRGDLWTVQMSDSTSAAPYLTSESDLRALSVAPTGDLAAFTSNESDTREVYVRSFPTPRQPIIVSQGGGTSPRWSPDGGTIYYWKTVTGPDSLFAAHVTRQPTFAVQSTEFVLAGDYNTFSWDLHPDGDRFVVPRRVQDAPAGAGDTAGGTDSAADADPERHIVVVNWFTELRAALGGGGN